MVGYTDGVMVQHSGTRTGAQTGHSTSGATNPIHGMTPTDLGIASFMSPHSTINGQRGHVKHGLDNIYVKVSTLVSCVSNLRSH